MKLKKRFTQIGNSENHASPNFVCEERSHIHSAPIPPRPRRYRLILVSCDLGQCAIPRCATRGPRAKSGPGAYILWPAERSRF